MQCSMRHSDRRNLTDSLIPDDDDSPIETISQQGSPIPTAGHLRTEPINSVRISSSFNQENDHGSVLPNKP